MHMHMCMCTCAYDAIPDTLYGPHVTHVQHYIVYMYRVALSHYPLTGTLRHTRSGSIDVGGHGEHEETFGTQWTVRVGKLRSTRHSRCASCFIQNSAMATTSVRRVTLPRPISHSRTTSGQRAARTTASSSTA